MFAQTSEPFTIEASMRPITVKVLAVLTAVMSIPLLLSYDIKYGRFPAGLPYALLFFWGLLSVVVVPMLLLVGLTMAFLIVKSSCVSRTGLLRWNLAGILVAVVAELIFIAARNAPP
jgi:hypothetical protein